MGKEQSLQQMMLGQLDVHVQNNKVDHYIVPHANINSQWVKDLKLKNFKKKRSKHFCPWIWKYILDIIPKEQAMKEK